MERFKANSCKATHLPDRVVEAYVSERGLYHLDRRKVDGQGIDRGVGT